MPSLIVLKIGFRKWGGTYHQITVMTNRNLPVPTMIIEKGVKGPSEKANIPETLRCDLLKLLTESILRAIEELLHKD